MAIVCRDKFTSKKSRYGKGLNFRNPTDCGEIAAKKRALLSGIHFFAATYCAPHDVETVELPIQNANLPFRGLLACKSWRTVSRTARTA